MTKNVSKNYNGKRGIKKVIRDKKSGLEKNPVIFVILNKLSYYFILSKLKQLKRGLKNNYNNIKENRKEDIDRLSRLGGVLKQYAKHFFLLPVLLAKILTPSFFIGTPNLWTNLKFIATKKEFKPLRMAMVSWAVFTFIIIQGGIFFFKNSPTAEAVSYAWFQTGWTASSTDSASHDSNRNGWTNYWDVYPTNITTTTGTEITLKTVASSTAQTTTADFDQGTTSTASVTGNAVQLSQTTTGQSHLGATFGSIGATFCGVDNSNHVYCWGENGSGQLGIDNAGADVDTPLQVLGVGGVGNLADISDVGFGGDYLVCSAGTDGTLFCWGANTYGGLGDNTTVLKDTPIQVLGVYGSGYLTDIASFGSGAGHSCASKTDGTAFCWGYNFYGQLGDDHQGTNTSTPVQVVGVGGSGFLTSVDSVRVGGLNTCAIKTDDSVFCWGYNAFYQLGDRTKSVKDTPVQVLGVDGSGYLSDVADVGVGVSYVCAVKTDGTVYCWGNNASGQLGIDSATSSMGYPTQVLGTEGSGYLSDVADISVGSSHVCAVKTDGTVYCWGSNTGGALGIDSATSSMGYPVQVVGVGASGYLTDISEIGSGSAATCAVDSDGDVYCWGNNASGELGDNNSPTDSDTPIQVVGVGGSGTLDLLINTYNSSGTFTSNIIDTSSSTAWNTMTWTTSTLANTAVTMRVRTGQRSDMSDAAAWSSSCDVDNTGNDISANSCVTDGHRYIQYQAALSTEDISVTPELQNVTINYTRYTDTEQTLTSSMFDTENLVTALSEISWSENLPTSSTEIKFQIRTSADGTTWGSWLGPTDGNDYYTDPSGGETINSAHRDGEDDRWAQYKLFISSSDGGKTPTLFDVSFTYTINESPQISGSGITATQLSNGNVQITWGAYDSDTGTATTSFQYSLDNGSNWSDVLGHLTASATTTRSVSGWTTTTITWTAKSTINGQYASQFKIKVIEDDGERTNNIVSSTSNSFALDVDNPDLSTPAIRVVATTTPATIYNFATDNNSMQMAISLDSGMSGAVWETYAATNTITLATDPDTVYAQFRDSFANTTTIQSAVTPGTPSNLVIRDLSNTESGDYRLFIAWSTVAEPGPGFDRYDVWSSTDGITYTLLDTIASRSTNYYLHQNLSEDDIFYYKISTVDDYGNTSSFSSVVSDTANGQGGTDSTPPTISNVAVSATTTQGFTVTWDTDEPSDSTIDYSTVAADFSSSVGVGSMVDTASGLGRHSVVLTGLTPDTTYYFRVVSEDPDINSAIDNNGGDGYEVTTLDGPAISNVSASSIQNAQATITWNTDEAAVSSVFYSTSSSLSGATQVSNDSEVTAHSTTITGLTQGTKYYFYVTSGVATDNNGGEYYTFTTTADSTGPVITSVSASPVADITAVINWNTNEWSTSQVCYGTVSGALANYSIVSTSLNLNHMILLSSLTQDTTYYYTVASVDGSSNPTTSTEYTFTTLETLSEESAVEAREAAARAVGTNEASNSGGGGFPYIPTDNIPPIISKLKVANITPISATILWDTDEAGDSAIEYGVTSKYGDYYFDFVNAFKTHSANLLNLSPSTVYNYRVSTADKNGNRVYSENQTFMTISGFEEVDTLQEFGAQDEEEKGGAENMFKSFIEKTTEIIKRMSKQVSVAVLESGLDIQYSTIDELGKLVPLPLIGGQPVVEAGSSYARVFWTTDKLANSQVAIASDLTYQDNQEYTQVVGNADEQVVNHEVLIEQLRPNTLYHYQVRSKTPVSDTAKSRDFTFKTKEEQAEIITYKIESISDNEAVFTWVTNVPTDSKITYIPYGQNGTLQVDSARSAYDKAVTTVHEVTAKEFEAGLIYQVEMLGEDFDGNIISKTLSTFSTSETDAPPVISQVQTDAALLPGEQTAVQAIISWITNEPATSQVFYQKGFGKKDDSQEFIQKTPFDPSYVKHHIIVITNFDPGAVYQFQLESVDSSGNMTRSKTHTILTPRQKESVFQVIMSNMEETFSWVGELGL